MKVQHAEVIGLGVDWITATAEAKRGGKQLQRLAERKLLSEQVAGNEVKEVNIEGYRGLSCGSAYGGSLGTRFMIRFSSHLAREHWPDIARHAQSVSRFDVQATVRYKPARPNLAEIAEAWAVEHKQGTGGKYEVELRRNDVKGATLYTGRRTSLRFGRVYDKGKESGHEFYEGAWRFEVEEHKRAAMRTVGTLYKSSERSLQMFARVSGYFRSKGILVPKFDRRLTFDYEPRPTADHSLRRTLAWYQKQVRPSLSLTVSCAGVDVVLEALGLSDLCTPKQQQPTPKEGS